MLHLLLVPAHFDRLEKKYLPRRSRTSAAKAGSEDKPVIAAVNRCATQNQVQHRLFPQPLSRAALADQLVIGTE
jgi:hypothetical protein